VFCHDIFLLNLFCHKVHACVCVCVCCRLQGTRECMWGVNRCEGGWGWGVESGGGSGRGLSRRHSSCSRICICCGVLLLCVAVCGGRSFRRRSSCSCICVCCSVLHCVAVCCTVLQCVDVGDFVGEAVAAVYVCVAMCCNELH